MFQDIENCKLQNANCKLTRADDNSAGGNFRQRTQFSIFNFQFSICNSPRRRGFTLVEVLVVIAIIGLLVGLLLPAVFSAMSSAKKGAIMMEIKQLVAAVERVRTEIGGSTYPPDGSNGTDMAAFFKRAFPRYTGAAPMGVTPDTALVFWLGGAQDGNGNFIGFSANAQNPFDANAGRIGPYFDFDKTRISTSVGTVSGVTAAAGATWNLIQFFPKNGIALNATPAPAPYVYFKAVAGAYPSGITPKNGSTAVWPYSYSPPSSGPVNPANCQILCPGMDGNYGAYTSNPLYPAGTNYDQKNGLDDMTNFTNGATVKDDIP